jgi:hypothetical protein
MGTRMSSYHYLAGNWSFAELKRVETLWGPHGYHRYPAKFIPQFLYRTLFRAYIAT